MLFQSQIDSAVAKYHINKSLILAVEDKEEPEIHILTFSLEIRQVFD